MNSLKYATILLVEKALLKILIIEFAIENLNWVLDVIFKEDSCLANMGYLAENQEILKRFAINIIKTVDPKRVDFRQLAEFIYSFQFKLRIWAMRKLSSFNDQKLVHILI